MRHRFHSLCPYFAMFPESFAEKWLGELTEPGDWVLDPFSGRGTTPFQSLLMGRNAIATDINPVAYCISRAKTNAPPMASILGRLTRLEREFREERFERERRELPPFFRIAYRPQTLRQLLFLRERLRWAHSDVDCMLAALVLGSLHGESEKSDAYLSNQMPHTIATKPDYSVRFWKRHGFKAPERDVFALLRDRLAYRYVSTPPSGTADVRLADMRELPRLDVSHGRDIRCAITSPPYFDVTSYEEDQWLRLWFLGRQPKPSYRKLSKDDRLENRDDYWRLIGDMWRTLGRVMGRKSHVVVRLGAVRIPTDQLVSQLAGTSVLSGRRVRLISSSVSEIARRQTDAFRPGSAGCKVEVDCHFALA